ncbi:MAG: DUF2029 domain-containing protein [Thermoanaerobaculaceae bacterium]|nr:DUF2029 domain-containing protein [Thermoanaerobaculaceae bacterium]
MNETTEIWVKGILSLVALLVVILRHTRVGRLPERRAGQLLAGLAVVACAAYYNFGLFHGWTYVHHWETFHYVLGSKYFPELGYDGLYVASVAAQLESAPEAEFPSDIRNLKDNRIEPVYALAEQRAAVRARFSPQRWQAFLADNDYFVRTCQSAYLAQIRRDHGYNPTPAWTFVGRLFSGALPVGRRTLVLLGLLDPLLLVLTFLLVIRTYGSRVGALALVIFGLGYPWRFDWIGGAFLRLDWFAAVVAAICLLKRERYAWAGALVGYATMVRIFPVLFLPGVAVLALKDLLGRRQVGWVWRFAAGFVLAVVVCLTAGSLAGRGAKGWQEFAANLKKHSGSWLTNNVGLRNIFLYEAETFRQERVNPALIEPFAPWALHMERLSAERKPLWLAGTAFFFLLALTAAWRLPRDEAASLGVVFVFAAVLLTSYYWLMLVVLAFRRGWGPAAGWLGVNTALYAVHLIKPRAEATFGAMCWGLTILFLLWLAPQPWRVVRRRRPVPREARA